MAQIKYTAYAATIVLLAMSMEATALADPSASHLEFGIKRDPVIQDILQKIVPPIKNKSDFFYQLQKLRELADSHFQRFIPQLIYFSVKAEGMREAMLPSVVIKQLKITKSDIANGYVNYLGTGNSKVESIVRKMLSRVEQQTCDDVNGFSIYRKIIREKVIHQSAPSIKLLRYMFEKIPGSALLVTMRAHLGLRPKNHTHLTNNENRQIIWTEHVVSNNLWKQKNKFIAKDAVDPKAMKALVNLSDSRWWWARLYVAEIMLQHPEFQQQKLLDILKDDKNKLVRQTILAISDADSAGKSNEKKKMNKNRSDD